MIAIEMDAREPNCYRAAATVGLGDVDSDKFPGMGIIGWALAMVRDRSCSATRPSSNGLDPVECERGCLPEIPSSGQVVEALFLASSEPPTRSRRTSE